MDYIRKEELMRKNSFLRFLFWPIATLNPSFKVHQNYSNCDILAFAQSFSNLKIDSKISHRVGSMVKNIF